MKKYILICMFAFISLTGVLANERHNGFAIGIGLYGGYGYGPGLMIKTPGLPLYFGINVSLDGIGAHNEEYFGISVSGDYHFIDAAFPGNERFGWFLGGGIIFSHSHFDGENSFAGRIPVGMYFTPAKHFDFVLELAPSAGVVWTSNIKFDYGMSGLFGIRYWF